MVWVNWNHVAFWAVHLQQEHKGDRGDQQAARPVARANGKIFEKFINFENVENF